jgi:hypothetical protein
VLEEAEYLTVTFCVEKLDGTNDESCEISIPLRTVTGTHQQEFGHASEISGHGISGFRCELIGHWTTETGGTHDGQAEQTIELAHN